MNNLTAIPGEVDPWETGDLGKDEKYVECASAEVKREIETSLELQMISIRLQKELIEELKLIANYRGIGYQPLMRDVLCRFARAEILQIAAELTEQQKARETIEANERLRA